LENKRGEASSERHDQDSELFPGLAVLKPSAVSLIAIKSNLPVKQTLPIRNKHFLTDTKNALNAAIS